MPRKRKVGRPKVPEDQKRELLAYIRSGVSIQKSCKAVGVAVGSYYNWKKKDPSFEAAAEIALAEAEKAKDELENIRNEPVFKLTGEWKDEFLYFYVRYGGNMTRAADTLGLQVEDVMAYLNPASNQYDEAFAVELERRQPIINRMVLDSVLDEIAEGGRGSAASAKWYLERAMPEQFGDKKVVKHSGQVDMVFDDEKSMELFAKILDDDRPKQITGESEVPSVREITEAEERDT